MKKDDDSKNTKIFTTALGLFNRFRKKLGLVFSNVRGDRGAVNFGRLNENNQPFVFYVMRENLCLWICPGKVVSQVRYNAGLILRHPAHSIRPSLEKVPLEDG